MTSMREIREGLGTRLTAVGRGASSVADRMGIGTVGLFVLAGLVALGLAFAAFWSWAFADLPKVPTLDRLWAIERQAGVQFLDREGRLIAVRGAWHGQRTALEDLPEHLVQAFLAVEDRRFFEHDGVSSLAVARAGLVNAKAGDEVQGGSTITQQLAKNLLLSPERTYRRKLQEIRLAWQIEDRFTKQDILELYLNRVFLGEQAWGVDGAARRYFGKPATELTLAEAALLAGLPKAPSRLAPTGDMAAARARQAVVLQAMVDAGFLTEAQAKAARAEPITLVTPPAEDPAMRWYLDAATAEARRLVGDAPDLVLRLAVDPALQAAGQRVLGAAVASNARARVGEGALVALAPDGAVLALIGGARPQDSKFNRAVQARRQPGSTFKTFVYAAALEAGLSPRDIRVDSRERGSWSPRNYHDEYRGDVTLRAAFRDSLNTVAVKVAREVGYGRVTGLARRLGVRTELEATPAMALGSEEVTLLDLTAAYSVFPREGMAVAPWMFAEVSDSLGAVLWRRDQRPVRVFDARLSHLMTNMMREVVLHGTATSARGAHDAAGKTGTSQGWRDAWFVAFTARHTVGVWVGNDDFTPMRRITGGSVPVEIWTRFMRTANQGLAPVDLPGRDTEDPPGADEIFASNEDGSLLWDEGAEADAGGGGVLGALADAADAFADAIGLGDGDEGPRPGPPPREPSGREPSGREAAGREAEVWPWDGAREPAPERREQRPPPAGERPPPRDDFYSDLADALGEESRPAD